MHLRKRDVALLACLFVSSLLLVCDRAYAEDCLNCAPPSADLLGGVTTTFVPGGGWILRPFGQVLGETPITLGSGQNSKTLFRAFSDVTIGTRTADTTVDTLPDASGLATVNDWTSAEVIGGASTVVGRSADGNVLTSAYAAAGGKVAISKDATVEPRVAKVVEIGARIQVLKAKADVRIGLGRDEEGLPETPTAQPDGSYQRTLQAIISARLPIVGTDGMAWMWVRASNPLMGEGRPVVSIGLAASPGSILSKLLHKGD
jgi:hypothetical protein